MTIKKVSIGSEGSNTNQEVRSGGRTLGNMFSNAGRYFCKHFKHVRDLNDAEFLSLFDIPEVIDRIDGGFNLKAHAALLEHFHQRVESDWLEPPAHLVDLAFNTDLATDEEVVKRAELVLDYDLDWSGIPPEINACGEIDWQKNILRNQQWLERINRHGWWPLLGHAYRVTGDERYAKAFAMQLSAWMNSNFPVDASNACPHIWSSRQVALRLRVSWIPAFGMFYNSPYFTTTRKLDMLRSIFDQARYLKQNNAADNLLLSGGLVSAGMSFPEVVEAGKWRKTAIRSCRELLANVPVNDAENGEFQRSTNLLKFSDRELAATACV